MRTAFRTVKCDIVEHNRGQYQSYRKVITLAIAIAVYCSRQQFLNDFFSLSMEGDGDSTVELKGNVSINAARNRKL